MGKVGINKGEWDAVVNKAQSQASAITTPTVVEISKTTLKRMKALEQSQEKLKQLVESYQKIVATETNKMKEVGERVVQEDEQAANSMKES